MKKVLLKWHLRLLMAGAFSLCIVGEASAKKFWGAEIDWQGCQYAYDGLCQKFGMKSYYVMGIKVSEEMVFETGSCEEVCPSN